MTSPSEKKYGRLLKAHSTKTKQKCVSESQANKNEKVPQIFQLQSANRV